MRNESAHVEELIRTVSSQTVRPAAWILVDGNSTDGCYEQAKQIARQYDWIYVIRQTEFYGKGYSHQNFALGVNDGCRYGLDLFPGGGGIRFIGKIDATVELDQDFLENMLTILEGDETLAFVCGQELEEIDGNGKGLVDDPFVDFNDIRLYRRDFLEPLGLYPISFSPDAVLIVKARSKDMNAKVCLDATFYDKRPGATKIGAWKGYMLKGEALWGLGYHPLIILIDVLYFGIQRSPHYHAAVVMFGYLRGFINKVERIEDPEVIEYFWKLRLRDAMDAHLKKA